MKKKIPALLLVLSLLLTIPAQAVLEAGFSRQRSYAGEFSDLKADSPFYDNVIALYEYGLANGKANGTFGLQDPLTVGQVVIFAGRIRGSYRTGNPEEAAAYRQEGAPEAQAHLRYLQAEGVLGAELDGILSQAASRAQVAHVLARVLPEEALPSVHSELVDAAYATGRYIADVTGDTPHAQDILDLYRKGVCVGSDAAGTFLPGEPITRGAAAAMITRMVDPALRLQPQWDATRLYSAAGATLASLVEPGTYAVSPSTEKELEESIRYMLSRGENQLVFYYPSVSDDEARQLMNQALSIVKDYCEQSYNEVHCTRSAGIVTLSFTAAGAGGNLESYRTATMEAAIAVHDQLWENGTIHEDMTEMEKARVYFGWICDNCTYDYQAGNNSLSHIPYTLFTKGTAVCDGYTGAYNLLLKLEGIACSSYISGDHIWTVATLDGVEYHIDTTWGDSGRPADYQYFAMTPQQSLDIHARRAG